MKQELRVNTTKTVYLSAWDENLSEDEWNLLSVKINIELLLTYSDQNGTDCIEEIVTIGDKEINQYKESLSFPLYDADNNYQPINLVTLVEEIVSKEMDKASSSNDWETISDDSGWDWDDRMDR
jgi:hypothetical protein